MAPRLIRSFFQAAGLMHRGKVDERLNAEMGKLLEAIEQHPDEKVSGTLTLSVTVTKVGDRLSVLPKVENKLPKEKGFSETTFWLVDGALSLEHPDQADMFTPRDAARAPAAG